MAPGTDGIDPISSPAAQAAATDADPTALKDSSAASLSAAFNALTSQNRARKEGFKPTFAKLNEIVTKFQDIGADQVGLERAGFKILKDLNLMSKPSPDTNFVYGILSIYDASFLIRIYPEKKIDCYTENLAKPTVGVQSLDSSEFWFRPSPIKDKPPEPKFLRYNLDLEEDVVSFQSAILQTAAECASDDVMGDFNVPAAEKGNTLYKPARLPSRKP